MPQKKLQVWLPLLFSIVMSIGMFLGYQLNNALGNNKVFVKQINNITDEVLALINKKYVDKINTDTLNQTAIDAILSKLDPHSVYIPASIINQLNDELKGNFQGIGIEFQFFNDTLNVTYVLEKGPAANAGVQIGDQLIEINDSLVAGNKKGIDDIKKLLHIKNEPYLALQLLRNNKLINAEVRKGSIPLPSVDASYIAAPQTGYIKLNKFSETTYIEFMQAMDQLKASGMKKLILDLRGNGGGVLDAAVNIADEFLPEEEMIVYTEGDKVKKKEYKTSKPGVFENGSLVVLMDELSASASEVLAGALQDNDRCTIVGRRSFGKGLVQEQYLLSDGGALRLTVARYYTPLGRCIQKSYSKDRKLYNDEIIGRIHGGNDSIFSTGKAYKTKKGKSVYDAGGISPDVYVKLDTSLLSEKTIQLYNTSLISDFAYQYYRQNKLLLSRYTDINSFNTFFNFSPDVWSTFIAFAQKNQSALQSVDAKLQSKILNQIKAFIAKQLWRSNGYFEVLNNDDTIYKKAVQVISSMN